MKNNWIGRIGRIGQIAVLALLAVGVIGCAMKKLEAGGAYAPVAADGTTQVAPDLGFYAVDSAFDIAYSAIDGAFKFERDNRALLWKVSPQIKHTLDQIRPQAWEAAQRYAAARKVYMANPVAANLSTLQEVLARVQAVSQAALAALPKP